MRTQSDFTEGKILGPLLKFSLPVLFAMLLQAMYGAADLLIVGQFGAAADAPPSPQAARSCRPSPRSSRAVHGHHDPAGAENRSEEA